MAEILSNITFIGLYESTTIVSLEPGNVLSESNIPRFLLLHLNFDRLRLMSIRKRLDVCLCSNI